MKIVYMGTPDFAVPPLQMLCDNGYEVGLVVTQPDKARDRGKKVQFTPVKEAALAYGIEVLQPEKIRDNHEFLAQLKAYQPDLIVVAAYGKILPVEILNLPPLGCINIHASLLPKYRGAAPIHRCIIEGEEETGITLMVMTEGLDEGDILALRSVPVANKTTAILHDELSVLGGELLIETLPDIVAGKVKGIKQEAAYATYAPMVFKQDGLIDFSKDPGVIACLIRGMNSWPGAYTFYGQEQMKVWEAEATQKKTDRPGGTILSVSKEGLEVAAGGGTLLITKLQMPGKRPISVGEYIKGNRLEIGTVLASKSRE